MAWTSEQVKRYSRHIILDGVGGKGQRKLLDSKVVIIGAGGLGSPVAMYLAAAGVGTIGIADFDSVDLSNLQRQIMHRNDRIGMLKTESAKETINGINPDVNVILHNEPIDSSNAMEVLKNYDIVVNGTDNFPTRYLVNDASYFLKKPLVDASILRFEGQAVVFMPDEGCYRCLFPAPPPPEMAPSCAEAGVLGVICGIMGSIQGIEVIKILLGSGTTLNNRLLLFDALEMSFREVKLRRDPKCPLCGDNPTVTELIDYEAFCGMPAREVSTVSA